MEIQKFFWQNNGNRLFYKNHCLRFSFQPARALAEKFVLFCLGMACQKNRICQQKYSFPKGK